MRRELPISLYFLLVGVLIVGNIFLYTSLFTPAGLRISLLETAEEGGVVLLRTPNNGTVLINTGPDASILRALGTELPSWQRKIDAIVLTDASAATIGGLPSVLERYKTTTMIRPIKQGTRSSEAIISDSIAENSLQEFSMGDNVSLDLGHGIRISTPSSEEILISYGVTSLRITKNTPFGVFFSDGKTLERIK